MVEAAGNKPKLIREYVGQVNSDTSAISIAVMQSPVGWIEPVRHPSFANTLSSFVVSCGSRTQPGYSMWERAKQ